MSGLEENMVFISYKSEEYDIAKKIRALLEENNYPCWMAPESISAGSNYMSEIPTAIRKCDLFILIVSEASQKSQWVQKEIDRAVKFDKYILPFHVDDSELIDAIDFVISNNQRIEAYQNFEPACHELLRTVRLRHPAVAPVAPKEEKAKKTAPEKTQPVSTPEAAAPSAPGISSELSPEMLMQLLGTLPPEYIEKLMPGYQANAAAKPEASAPQAPASATDAPVAAPLVSNSVVTPTAPSTAQPRPAMTVTKPITSAPKPTVATKPAPKPTMTAQKKPVPINKADEGQTVQQLARQALAQEVRNTYERNFAQNNIKGFKIVLGELTGYRPSRKEEGIAVVPYGVKEIGSGVFAKNKNLHCVVLPPTVEKVGPNAFLDCVNLEKVIFHEGLTHIETAAFQGCHLLEKVIFPKTLMHIGAFAFFDCRRAVFSVGSTVTHIGAAAFNNCGGVTVHAQHPVYVMHAGCLVDKVDHCLISAAADAQLPTTTYIKSIGDYAFEGNLSISQLNFSDSVTRIGAGAFRNCLNLIEVNMGDSMESISRQAFMNCTSLSTLNLKFGIGMIDHQAFSHCKMLRKVIIPKSVRFIAKDSFEGCPRVKITE